MRRLRNWLIVLGSGVVLIVTGGTLGFMWIDHYPPFDAFYMTLITITTVGYEEVHPLSFYGRIFNSFLMFFGVTMLLLAVGGMTQVIISLELTQYFGKRRTRKMINSLQDHIIVCGFGVTPAAKKVLEDASKPNRRRLYVTGQQVLAQILTLQPPDPAAVLLGALGVNTPEVRRRLDAVTPGS